MKFVDVKNDVAFLKIFGDAKKSIALISFLNAILELEGTDRIKSVTLINPYLLARLSEDKSAIIDVRATDQKGRRFVVEMQVASKKGFKQRVQYYASRDYSMQIDSGEAYPKLRPTYFIGIVNFSVSKGTEYVSRHLTVEQETGENLLGDIKYAFIQLPKFKKKIHELVYPTDKWTFFIKNAQNLNVIPDFVDDEGLKTAFIQADKYLWTKEELIAYDNIKMRETDAKMEREFAIEEALKEALTVERAKTDAEKVESILKMYAAGISIADIANFTNKTEAEIQKIIEKN